MTLGLGPTPAALATTTTVDCSTADLIYAMNNYSSGDTIVLAPFCTYTLTAGLPSVMHTLTIVGHNSTWIKRSYSASSFSVFTVGCTTGDLTLINVNVANGGGGSRSDGGAVYAYNGYLTVHGGIFAGNHTTTDGGAIYADGYGLTVDDGAKFTHNSSEYGGAILSYTTTTIDRGVIFSSNYASEYGGALYAEDPPNVTIDDVGFTNNYAASYGGAIYNDNTMAVSNSQFYGNRADWGGAIYNAYDLTVTASLFSLNRAFDDGGAFYNDDNLEVDSSTVADNQASGYGGGIYNNDETVTLNSDWITFNITDNCYPVNSIPGCLG